MQYTIKVKFGKFEGAYEASYDVTADNPEEAKKKALKKAAEDLDAWVIEEKEEEKHIYSEAESYTCLNDIDGETYYRIADITNVDDIHQFIEDRICDKIKTEDVNIITDNLFTLTDALSYIKDKIKVDEENLVIEEYSKETSETVWNIFTPAQTRKVISRRLTEAYEYLKEHERIKEIHSINYYLYAFKKRKEEAIKNILQDGVTKEDLWNDNGVLEEFDEISNAEEKAGYYISRSSNNDINDAYEWWKDDTTEYRDDEDKVIAIILRILYIREKNKIKNED